MEYVKNAALVFAAVTSSVISYVAGKAIVNEACNGRGGSALATCIIFGIHAIASAVLACFIESKEK